MGTDSLLAAAEILGLGVTVAVGVRYGLTSAYRQTAEGWKARAEEAALKADESATEIEGLRGRILTLEAQPNLEQHAHLLDRITTILDSIDERIERNEVAAALRHAKMIETLESISRRPARS